MEIDQETHIHNLEKVIDRAYWLIEVGDRLGALRELSRYAKPRDPNAPHWLTPKPTEPTQE